MFKTFPRSARLCLPSILLLVLGLTASGCQLIAMPFLAFGREPTKKVPAEYPYLNGKKLCILVWAEPYTEFEYQWVRLEVSEHVRIALEADVTGLAVIPNRQVVDYQHRDPDWESQDPARIGERFGADRVLMIELTQYTTREPGSPHLYRGHMGANVKLYDTAYPRAAPAYKTTIETAYPPDSMGRYGTDDGTIRRAMMQAFASQLAGRFCERQEKVQ